MAKPFEFKTSKLSSTADQLWFASKSGFKADEKLIKLDLGRTLANDKAGSAASKAAQPAKSTGFIFGSKLSERVTMGSNKSEKNEDNAGSGDGTKEKSAKDDSVKSVSAVFEEIKHKPSASSFTSAKKTTEPSEKNEEANTSFKSISNGFNAAISNTIESAESEPKESEVEITTGEEDEQNIYHTTCKLHSFDSASNTWTERGMCSLRINQRRNDQFSHRLVARVAGNQRVVLNSSIFPDMVVEKISAKRIKFSATTPESEAPVLFLATASEFVADVLFMKLTFVINVRKLDVVRKRKACDCEDNGSDQEDVIPRKVGL